MTILNYIKKSVIALLVSSENLGLTLSCNQSNNLSLKLFLNNSSASYITTLIKHGQFIYIFFDLKLTYLTLTQISDELNELVYKNLTIEESEQVSILLSKVIDSLNS